MPIEIVGLDGDDTLWESEIHFADAQAHFESMMARHLGHPEGAAARGVIDRLYDTERRNLAVFGYGVKAFTLSLIETAIEVTDGAITTAEIGELLARGREMLGHPTELLPDVAEVVPALVSAGFRLVLVTKGDLFDQERKFAGSGLAEHFERVEIVSTKDAATYRRILGSMRAEPDTFCMVGNSLPSDVLPVLSIGGHAVHIPHELTWALEQSGADHDGPTLTRLAELPAWLATNG
ncbi:MAG: HAD family hydrolase [Actinomycetota bacterium]|nr:HAD family hydrolase [Actinomycetota bacterium]